MRTEQENFETQMQVALSRVDMHCAEGVIFFWGDTGAGKSVIVDLAQGCILDYIPNPAGPNRIPKEVVDIVNCSSGATPAAIGHTQGSQTVFLAAYMQAGPNPSLLVDTPGSHHNNETEKPLVMMATQIGLKTTKTFKAHNLVLSYLHFGDPKVTALLENIKSLATMFKKPLREYLSAINLVLTKAPRNENAQEIKEKIVNALKEMSDTADDAFVRNPTIENQNKADLLAFLIAPENSDHIFIFNPLDQQGLQTWLNILKSRPAYPASELTLVGAEDAKREFIAQFEQTLSDSTTVLKAVVEMPGEIKALEKIGWELKEEIKNIMQFFATQRESLEILRKHILEKKGDIDLVNFGIAEVNSKIASYQDNNRGFYCGFMPYNPQYEIVEKWPATLAEIERSNRERAERQRVRDEQERIQAEARENARREELRILQDHAAYLENKLITLRHVLAHLLVEKEREELRQKPHPSQEFKDRLDAALITLEKTQIALGEARTIYRTNLVMFEHKQKLYQSIETLYQVIGFDSAVGETFHQFYLQALILENKMDHYPNVTQCYKQEQEFAKRAYHTTCFIEDGVPGIFRATNDCGVEQSREIHEICNDVFGKQSLVHTEKAAPQAQTPWTSNFFRDFCYRITGADSAGCAVAGSAVCEKQVLKM
ncbi:MAG: hypothetical protein A2624_05190 [Gammaproteobacteria bacterium RIFCSPHIGHO2_01_FULL_42_8]|nr:MAG: hypothetical protein A2624_05190 [Gammaproteobacteria bacterium RIFCSPHIGHO2_01_FULL_42_8]